MQICLDFSERSEIENKGRIFFRESTVVLEILLKAIGDMFLFSGVEVYE